MPLTNVMLELSGPDASVYQFSVEALFLGAPVMHVSGERVVLSGPTGREPLVGLRVALEEASESERQVTQTAQAHKTNQKNSAQRQPNTFGSGTGPSASLRPGASFPQPPQRQAGHITATLRELSFLPGLIRQRVQLFARQSSCAAIVWHAIRVGHARRPHDI